MEEEESARAFSRKELRKQKLMEYLAAKGNVKVANPKPNIREERPGKKPVKSALKVVEEKENKAPGGGSKTAGPKGPALTAETRQNPVRKVLGVTNKRNIPGSTVAGQKTATRPSSSSGPAQPRCNLDPELTRTYTIASFRSRLNPASNVEKQPIAGVHSSNKMLPAKPNNKLKGSKAASFGPVRSASVRMSLGPFVKTRTGLIPAATQPRNMKPNATHISTSAAHTNTSMSTTSTQVVKTLHSKSTSLGSVCKAALPVSSVTYHDGAQGQKIANSKPLAGKPQPSKNNQSLRRLNSASSSTMSAAASLKLKGREVTNRLAGQPADRTTKPKSVSKGEKTRHMCKAALQTCSKPVHRCSSMPSWHLRAMAVESNTQARKEIDSGKVNSPNQVQPRSERTIIPASSQTVPPLSKIISFTGHASNTRTPKVTARVAPQTEDKKLSAAQEERLRKLQEWREARGISYKRPPMPIRPPVRRTVSKSQPQPFWESMKNEDEVHSLICAVDRSLADCIKLQEEGCPPEKLKGVLSRLPPLSQNFAKYWICRARLMEQEGDLDVLPMFEEAVRVVLEPVDELRTVVFEILKKKDENKACEENQEGDQAASAESTPGHYHDLMMTPKPVRALIWGQKGDSSVIKYKITAPLCGPASKKRESARVKGQEVCFFTPVRRSVRIERASLRYPRALQDHDPCVASYDDLFYEEKAERESAQEAAERRRSDCDTPMYVYKENEALQDKVIVQLVCDDTV